MSLAHGRAEVTELRRRGVVFEDSGIPRLAIR